MGKLSVSPVPSGAGIAAGAYTGNGAASRTISVGFTPRAVLVVSDGGNMGGDPARGGLATTGAPAVNFDGSGVPVVRIVSGGFQVFYYEGAPYADRQLTNLSSRQYRYLALE